jgi:hypothetical protein
VSSAQGGSVTDGDRSRDPLQRLVGRLEFWIAVIAVELVLLVGHFWLTPSGLVDPLSARYAIYPLLWINAAIYAIGSVDLPSAPGRRRAAVGAVAVGYLLALAWLGGLVRLDPIDAPGIYLHSLGSPGWGPRIVVMTSIGYLQVIPYRVIGYPALAFLLYARLLETGGAVLKSAVGLVSCVSCSLPLFAALAGGGLGLGAGVGATLTTHAVDLSTAAYLLAVGLLLWRPGAIRDRLRSGGRTG